MMANYTSVLENGAAVDAELIKVRDSNLNPAHKITRSATLVVAASDSSAKSKAQADYVCDGINDEVEIQAAITALPTTGDRKVVLMGDFIKGNVPGISVPSNTEIEIHGSITFKTNVGDGAIIFQNTDSTNENISIIGGILDGNKANQSSGYQTAIQFTSVNRSVVDTLIKNFCGYNVREISAGIGNTIINRAYPNSVPEPHRTQERLMTKWKLIDDFSEGWSAVAGYGTLEYDENVKLTGTKSAHVTNEDGTEGKIIKTLPQFDLRNKNIALRVSTQDPVGYAYLRLRIYTDAARTSSMVTVEMRPPAGPLLDTWYIVGTDPSTYNSTFGSPDLSTCQVIQIELFGSPIDIHLDALYIADKPQKRGAVILNFDDGHLDTYTQAMPRMNLYGYRGVVGVCGARTNTASYPNYMSLDQMQHLSLLGWDIINHQWGHQLISDYSDFAMYEDEFRKNQDFLKSHNLGNGYRFFRPYGQHVGSAERWEMINKYAAIGCGGLGVVSAPVMSAADLKTDYYFGGTYQTIPSVAEIADAVSKGRILHYGFHNVNDEESGIALPTALFEQLLANIHEAGADVITLSDFYDNYLFTEPQSSVSGTATITASATTVDVTHGLAAAPTRVLLSPTTATAGKQYYVSAKAANTFTITIDSAADADISFDWQATL